MNTSHPLVVFMAGATGRFIRSALGLLIAAIGYFYLAGPAQWAAYLVGAVFFLSGVLNFCGIAPLLGGPFFGRSVR